MSTKSKKDELVIYVKNNVIVQFKNKTVFQCLVYLEDIPCY